MSIVSLKQGIFELAVLFNTFSKSLFSLTKNVSNDNGLTDYFYKLSPPWARCFSRKNVSSPIII